MYFSMSSPQCFSQCFETRVIESNYILFHSDATSLQFYVKLKSHLDKAGWRRKNWVSKCSHVCGAEAAIYLEVGALE